MGMSMSEVTADLASTSKQLKLLTEQNDVWNPLSLDSFYLVIIY